MGACRAASEGEGLAAVEATEDDAGSSNPLAGQSRDMFLTLSPKLLEAVLLHLDSKELLAWRGVSKARRGMFASESHAVVHGRRLLLHLHHSGMQLEALARIGAVTSGNDMMGCGDGNEGSNNWSQPFESLAATEDDRGGVTKAVVPDDAAASPVSEQQLLPQRGSVWSVAHRGCSAVHEGNTLPAFLEAVRVGAEMIELDVAACKTGQVVVHHDELLHATGPPVLSASLDEIREAHPATLEVTQVLSCPGLRDSNIKLYLDLKGDRVVRPLMDAIQEAVNSGGWDPSRLLIASFNQFDLLEVNAWCRTFPELSSMATGVIIDAVPVTLAKSPQELGATWICVGKSTCKPDFIQDAKSRGMGVMAWTVNEPKQIESLMREGVDAIISDYPERVQAARNKVTAMPQQQWHTNEDAASLNPGGLYSPTAESSDMDGVDIGDSYKSSSHLEGGDGTEHCPCGGAHGPGETAGGPGLAGVPRKRLVDLLETLYHRGVSEPRRMLVWAVAEAKALGALCTRDKAVRDAVSGTPQGDQLLRELRPSAVKAEALAAELLRPAVLAWGARKAAARLLSYKSQPASANNCAEPTSEGAAAAPPRGGGRSGLTVGGGGGDSGEGPPTANLAFDQEQKALEEEACATAVLLPPISPPKNPLGGDESASAALPPVKAKAAGVMAQEAKTLSPGGAGTSALSVPVLSLRLSLFEFERQWLGSVGCASAAAAAAREDRPGRQ